MATRWITVRREEGMEAQAEKVQLADLANTAARSDNTAARWEYQTKRDNKLFEAAWYADFRERWKRDLQEARFAGRLSALEVA
jgi:hypothetical protein